MPKKTKLDREEVRRWLSGQRAAAALVQRERVQHILSLTPTCSLALYLELKRTTPFLEDEKPSPLLWRVRRALARRYSGG